MNSTKLLLYIYDLSHGNADEIIRRKHLEAGVGLSVQETKNALKDLTQRGLIRPIIFGSLCITHLGVSQAEKVLQQTTADSYKKPSVLDEHLPQIRVLFLAATPTDAAQLRVGEEVREIGEKLQLSKLRDRFKLEQRMSVRPDDLSQALLDIQPQIVHFSGHGTSAGALCFEDKAGKAHPITPKALTRLFELFEEQVQCVLLNACYSQTQARAIATHIPYVMGVNKVIGERAAIAFSIGFYQGIGAGKSIEEAYQLGCAQIMLQGLPEHLTPILLTKKNRLD